MKKLFITILFLFISSTAFSARVEITGGGGGGSGAGDIEGVTAGAGISGGGTTGTVTVTAASDEADFILSGALTCGTSTQGKAKVHTTPLQYCDNAATPALQYAAYGSSTGVATSATALAANGANCSAGNYPLGVDASGAVEDCTAAGAGGAPTDADYLIGTANGSLSAEIVVGTTPGGELGNTWASPTIDDGVTVADWIITGSLAIPQGIGPTVNAAGEIAIDTTKGQLLIYDGTAVRVIYYEDYHCAFIENLISTDINMLIDNAREPMTVIAVSCRTSGFSTQPTLTFEDDSGNAMTGSPTCNATSGQDWTAVTSAGALTLEEGMRFDTTNTPLPVTGTQSLICWAFTRDAQ